jgi:hypothetical protein
LGDREPEDQGSGRVIANTLGEPTFKIFIAMLTGGVFQGAEHLVCKNDTLSSNLNHLPTPKIKEVEE